MLLWSIGTGVKRRADSMAVPAIIEGFAPDLAHVQNWHDVIRSATAVAHATAHFCAVAGGEGDENGGRGSGGVRHVRARSTRNLQGSRGWGSQFVRCDVASRRRRGARWSRGRGMSTVFVGGGVRPAACARALRRRLTTV